MSATDLLQLIWAETWWSWERRASDPRTFWDFACHYFNLVEAAAWFTFAALVFWRWMAFRRSGLEIVYAVAFVVFGISDVIESRFLTSWLLWWKAINLLVLFQLRKVVMRRYYPDRRLF